jgi:hypothetical protein
MTLPFSVAMIEPKGRGIGRVGEDEMAIGGRDAAHALYGFSMWENPSESEIHIAWAREPEGGGVGRQRRRGPRRWTSVAGDTRRGSPARAAGGVGV